VDRVPTASDTQSPIDVVAIDGPSGAGKSTVARRLAAQLGYAYLDTGAMYRAVTWHLLENQHADLADEARTAELVDEVRLELPPGGRVLLGGHDVTSHLRSREVESRVSAVSALSVVRQRMRAMQRELAARGPLVAEGRDMTSVVFPNARWKFFLDAEPEERGRRRFRDVSERGDRRVSEADVLEELAVRDRLDSTRRDAPLTRTKDAVYLDTTGMSVDQVVGEILRHMRPDPDHGARTGKPCG
jgi:pantoate ligase/cytidylate kinase